MHLCAGLTAASWIMDPFGEIGTNFSLQHSLLKLEIKKLWPKINVKNIKTRVYMLSSVVGAILEKLHVIQEQKQHSR